MAPILPIDTLHLREELRDGKEPGWVIAAALVALVDEQRQTNELLRGMMSGDGRLLVSTRITGDERSEPLEFDEGADWSEYQEQQQEEYVRPPILCFACEHTEAEHTSGGCTAANENNEQCGCKEFDDIPF